MLLHTHTPHITHSIGFILSIYHVSTAHVDLLFVFSFWDLVSATRYRLYCKFMLSNSASISVL
jgi:hypothetical protein